METIKLRDEFIKLGQALKAAGLVESGVEAKEVIQDGQVSVNGEIDTTPWKKIIRREMLYHLTEGNRNRKIVKDV